MTDLTRREFLAATAVGAAGTALGSISILAPSRALGANDRLSIGLIGVGGRMGEHMTQIHNAQKDLNVEITAVCDTWRVAREKAAATVNGWYGSQCRTFSNFEDLLALQDVDAVVIATPDFAHTPILIAAMKAGKDVYVEKPVSIDLDEANASLDTLAETKRIVQVGTQRRSDGKWKAAAKMAQSGVLGTISRIEIGWNDAGPRWARGFSEVKEADVDWKRFLMDRPYRPFEACQYRRWQLYRDFTNGPIGLLGSHYFDLVAWLMDDPFPSTAVAHGGHYVWNDGRQHEDTVYALLEYPRGFMCRYLTGLGNSAESGCRVYGTNGMFSESTWTFAGAGGGGSKIIKDAVKVQPEHSENHMRNWLECVRSRNTPNAPLAIGYQSSVACILAYEALRTGKKLKYLPVLRKIVEC